MHINEWPDEILAHWIFGMDKNIWYSLQHFKGDSDNTEVSKIISYIALARINEYVIDSYFSER